MEAESRPTTSAALDTRGQFVPPLAKCDEEDCMGDEERAELHAAAVDWALSHGLVMRTAVSGRCVGGEAAIHDGAVQHAPFTLFPSPFPRALYEQAIALQPHFNSLVHGLTRDPEHIIAVTRSIGEADAFTMRLLEIYESGLREAAAAGVSYPQQPVSLGILRSDYMVDTGSGTAAPRLLQVELNTIAASFGALSSLTSRLHAFLARSSPAYALVAGDPSLTSLPEPGSEMKQQQLQLPSSNVPAVLAAAIAIAHARYGVASAVVLFVVQPGERNALDQRHVEHALLENHGIVSLRRTLHEISRDGHIGALVAGATCGALRIARGGAGVSAEVSVAYFRAGYSPDDYPTSGEWRAREMIERSRAIKCPTVAAQLAGTKKMQQVLAQAGQVERYLLKEPAAAVRECFAGLYSLDNEEVVGRAMAADSDGGGFVLKPQREGGGNNIYGRDVAAVLRRLPAARDRAAYILMDRIRPAVTRNVLMRPGVAASPMQRVVSELGVFGVYVADGNALLHSATAGHLLRTKPADANEGGVATGFAVLDTPLLYDA